MGYRAHQAGPDHIVGHLEDRNRRHRLLCGANGRISTEGHNDIDLGLDQLCRMLGELPGSQSKTLPVDLEVLTLDETEPAQFVKKCSNERRITR
jgi:hypothetical protein